MVETHRVVVRTFLNKVSDYHFEDSLEIVWFINRFEENLENLNAHVSFEVFGIESRTDFAALPIKSKAISDETSKSSSRKLQGIWLDVYAQLRMLFRVFVCEFW